MWLGEKLVVREALDVPAFEADARGVLPPLTFRFKFGKVSPGRHDLAVVVQSLSAMPRFAPQTQRTTLTVSGSL